jgi:hypothetical protein
MKSEPAAPLDGSTEVVVRRHWNGTDGAAFRPTDVSGFHWSRTSGGSVTGFARVSPRPMVHAYVQCDSEPLRGELAHSCVHGPPPHRIKVCLVAKDNSRQVMTWAKQCADEQQREDPRRRGYSGG